MVSHAGLIRGLRRCVSESATAETRALLLPQISEVAHGGSKSKASIDGDRIWNAIQETIVQVFPDCWTAQELIVQALIAVNVRRIYMDQFDFVVDRLMREQEWTISTLANILVIICPRRFGKTKATAAVVATLLICIPRFKHVHFSLTIPFAMEFLEEVKAMVLAHPLGHAMLNNSKRQVQGIITLKGGPNDVRTCKVLAAKEKVIRFIHVPPPPHPLSLLSYHHFILLDTGGGECGFAPH